MTWVEFVFWNKMSLVSLNDTLNFKSIYSTVYFRLGSEFQINLLEETSCPLVGIIPR
jgi:hypothetical protein